MKRGKLSRLAVWSALLLMLCLFGMQALAAENTDMPEIEFFDQLKAVNHLNTVLFIAGGIFILIGLGGFLWLILWSRADKRRGRAEKDRADIFDEIKQAEMRNRRQREQIRKAAEQPVQKTEHHALHDTQENDFYGPQRAGIMREMPIVPTTPVSMQPGEGVRPRVQTPVMPVTPQPVAVHTSAPVEKQAEEKPAAMQEKPQTEQSDASSKYDVDAILREIREGKI